MARSTYMTFLMYKIPGSGSSDYIKLVDIKDFPDLGGTPEMLETTTLSDAVQTNIAGIQSLDSLEFTANYTPDDYSLIKDLEGQDIELAVWMGGTKSGGMVTPSGSEGKWSFTGQLSVFVAGGGVNEVVDMKITASASTPLVFI